MPEKPFGFWLMLHFHTQAGFRIGFRQVGGFIFVLFKLKPARLGRQGFFDLQAAQGKSRRGMEHIAVWKIKSRPLRPSFQFFLGGRVDILGEFAIKSIKKMPSDSEGPALPYIFQGCPYSQLACNVGSKCSVRTAFFASYSGVSFLCRARVC